jgi:hypothetical protein
MTPIQQALVAGFRAQLAVRGITLALRPDRGTFPALVEQFGGPQPGSVADTGVGVLEPEQRGAVRLALLREDLGATVVRVGDVFRHGTTDYRVVRLEPGGIDVAARFTCEKEDAPD